MRDENLGTPTFPAILNAIAAAAGIRAKELPVSPETLWRLLRSSRKNANQPFLIPSNFSGSTSLSAVRASTLGNILLDRILYLVIIL